MQDPTERRSVEQDIRVLKRSLHKYADGAHPVPELAPDITKAIQTIADHVVALHRRVARLEGTVEASEDEWTTRGWEPPPGTDRAPGAAT